jgi:hypothetical protein
MARAIALLASTAVAVDFAGACMELQGSLGSDCIKNQDCQSAICSEGTCVAAPPYLDGQVGMSEAGTDATVEGGPMPRSDGSGEAAEDALAAAGDVQQADALGSEVETSTPPDAPAEAQSAHPEASLDATDDETTDAPPDGHQDAGEAG